MTAPAVLPEEPAPEVVTEVTGRAGVITLNRPAALNALTMPMVRHIADALEDWRHDDRVELVLLTGAGERGLCAGGDVIGLQRDALAGGLAGARFWAAEYPLNLAISCYPKPYVALMRGLVLGGGIGLASHGSHRIVTDGTRVGMPETGIGFVPDVGGSWLLTRRPGHLGTHLALTGSHVGPAEAIEVGLADAYVPAGRLDDLTDALCRTGDLALIEEAAGPAPGGFGRLVPQIEAAYTADTVAGILTRLDDLTRRDGESSWARTAAARIRRNSPLALSVALESLRRAAGQTLAQALDTEFRVSVAMQRTHDFVEGVRAQLVDKDRAPRWRPATLAEVTAEDVATIFAPPADPRIVEPRLAAGDVGLPAAAVRG